MATAADERRAKIKQANDLDYAKKSSEMDAINARKMTKIAANEAAAKREQMNAEAYGK